VISGFEFDQTKRLADAFIILAEQEDDIRALRKEVRDQRIALRACMIAATLVALVLSAVA